MNIENKNLEYNYRLALWVDCVICTLSLCKLSQLNVFGRWQGFPEIQMEN